MPLQKHFCDTFCSVNFAASQCSLIKYQPVHPCALWSVLLQLLWPMQRKCLCSCEYSAHKGELWKPTLLFPEHLKQWFILSALQPILNVRLQHENRFGSNYYRFPPTSVAPIKPTCARPGPALTLTRLTFLRNIAHHMHRQVLRLCASPCIACKTT